MTKRQFLITVLCTTLFLVVALIIANRYYDVNQSPIASTVQPQLPSEPIPSPKPIAPPESFPRTIIGKIIGITDGDTITVLTAEQKQYKIRLSGIDAPEHNQDFGNKSKEYLSSLIFGKDVHINATKLDKYGRTLGQIFIGEKDMNLEMIKAGLAWHYKQYENEQSVSDRETYAEAEIQARKKKIGIWSMPHQIPPWEFRHPELSNSNITNNF